MEDKRPLILSPAPHMTDPKDTAYLMRGVLIACLPSLVWAVYLFGLKALELAAVCVGGCIFFEWVTRKTLGRSNTVGDWSAAVTGMILAMILPAGIPRWMALIGCFTAIVVVKQLFGGLGGNFANPAAVAGITLLLSFPKEMTTWEVNERMCNAIMATGISGGSTPIELFTNAQTVPTDLQMFFGFVSGPMGEISTLMLLLGGIWLIVRKIIDPVAPLCFLLSVIAISLLSGLDPFFQIMAGGVMFGAIFMASDPVTTPVTYPGKAIFGICCGVLTMLMRRFATYPDSMLFAILLMNILTPHIDRLTSGRVYKGGDR